MSLPSRECGLKSRQLYTVFRPPQSLPSRECGLKCGDIKDLMYASASLPSRECGLKSVTADYHTLVKGVTPFAGVWIEMFDI